MVWRFSVLAIALGLSVAVASAAETGLIEKFRNAVSTGDTPTAITMLAADPSLATTTDRFKFQPVHLMDMYFEPEILAALLAKGADINARNDEGVTLLHIITDAEAVAVLVRNGADIEARDDRGRTPLIMQVGEQQNGPDVVEALLRNGADPNARDNNGQTPSSIAIVSGNSALLQLLKTNGARAE